MTADLTALQKAQLRKFCAYGFLKNLQFFEPFLILVFLDRGLSFTQIGVLVAFRAICVNIMEIPSGAAADHLGRRRAMAVSMTGYMISFCIFAAASEYLLFFPAMFAFAVGEAFRTGTRDLGQDRRLPTALLHAEGMMSGVGIREPCIGIAGARVARRTRRPDDFGTQRVGIPRRDVN